MELSPTASKIAVVILVCLSPSSCNSHWPFSIVTVSLIPCTTLCPVTTYNTLAVRCHHQNERALNEGFIKAQKNKMQIINPRFFSPSKPASSSTTISLYVHFLSNICGDEPPRFMFLGLGSSLPATNQSQPSG